MHNLDFVLPKEPTITNEDGDIIISFTITEQSISQYVLMKKKIELAERERAAALCTVHSPNGSVRYGSSGSVRQAGNPTAEAVAIREALAEFIRRAEQQREAVVLGTEVWLQQVEREDMLLADIMRRRYTAEEPEDRLWENIEHEVYHTFGSGDAVRMKVSRYWKKYPEGIQLNLRIPRRGRA